MSADQMLTTNLVSGALIKSMKALEIQARSLGPTIGQAGTIITNNIVSMVGEFDQATGATKSLASGLIGVANKMLDLGRSFNEFFVANKDSFSSVFSVIGDVLKLLVLYKGAMLAVTAATKAYVLATATFAAINFLWKVAQINAIAYAGAINATTIAVGLYKAAMIALGNTIQDVDKKAGKSLLGVIAKIGIATAAAFGLNAALDAAMAPRDSDNVFKDLTKDLETQKAKIAALKGTDTDAVSKANKIDVVANLKKEFQERVAIARQNKESYEENLKLARQKYAQDLEEYELQQKRGQELIDMGSTGGKDTGAAKEAADKLAQMKEFSAQYSLQIKDQQEINRLVAEGKTIEDARYKVELDRQLIDARKSGATESQVADMRAALTIAKEQTIAAKEYEEAQKAIQKQVEFNQKAQEDFYKKEADFLKPEKFEIGDLFGDASKSAGALINVFDTINKQQEEYNELLADAVVYNKDVSGIEKQRAKNELRNIGSILGATKGFFKEKSAGYKVLSAAEQAFRIFELAQTAKSFAVKLGFINAETGAYVAGSITKKATEAGFTAFTVVQKGIQAAASGVAALASSMAGLPFPLNLAAFAATAGLLASIGLGIGGGKKSGKFAPTNEGVGTVFGDKEAKSESIKRSIDLLAENSKIELPITSAMLRSLQNIESNIGGLTNLLIRNNGGVSGEGLSAGVATGSKFSNSAGEIFNKALTGYFDVITLGLSSFLGFDKILGSITGALFGKTKTSIKGQGLFAEGQTFSQINEQGFSLKDYVDVNIKKKSLFSSSSKNKTITSAADEEISRQFGLVLKGFYDSVRLAATPLGENLDDVTSRLDNFVVNIGKINLKGLKGEEIQEKLEAVFGAAADSIAQAAIPGLEDFQKVGEGYFETVIRVSSGIEQAAQALREFGIAAVNFKDIVNTQGNVGIEIVRQSLLNREIASQVTTRQTGSITIDRTTQANANKAVQDTINTLTAAGFKNIAVSPEFITRTTQEILGSSRGLLGNFTGAATRTAQALFGELFTGVVQKVGNNFVTTITAVSGEIDFAYDVVSTKLTGIGEIIKSFTGDSVEELVSLVKELYNLRDLQRGFGVVVADVSVAMIQAAGSFDAFKDGVESFYENFTTPQEKIASQTNILTREFARLGLQLPATRDAYKNLVLTAANNTTVAGQEMYGSLIRLSPLFVELREAIEDVGGSAEEVGQSLNDVAKNLYQTIADARSKALTPTQSVDFLLGQFRDAQALAISQNGQALATTAGDINSQINPLLEAIKEVYASGETAQRLIDEVLGGAKVVADRAATEAFTFQDESLRLLQTQVNELEAIRIAIQGGTFTPSNIIASAMGNAFSGGNVIPFAKGGAFTNSIVSQPTMFPLGLMGEAGAEAVMPLARGSDGSLGVRIVGGNSSAGVESKLDESNRQSAALVRLQQEANKRIIEKLSAMEERLGGLESAARLEAAS